MSTFHLFGLLLDSDFPFASHLGAEPGPGSVADRLELTWGLQVPEEVPQPPAEGEVAYRSPIRGPDDVALAELYRRPGFDLYRFPHCTDFYLWEDRLHCQLAAPDLVWLAEIRLLGPVMAFWLERAGLACLHASAVVEAGGAVGFLATHGGGKTALAAAMLRAGWSLLSDDILPVEETEGALRCRPSYPQMRMEPDSLAYFAPHLGPLPKVHPGYSKLRVPVGGGGLGTFSSQRAPLSVLYLPRRGKLGSGAVEIRPLSPSEALIELVRHSFLPHAVEALGFQPYRLSLLARLVERVPVRELVYSSGFNGLEAVTEAILRDCEGSE